jgi:hypothetical protein
LLREFAGVDVSDADTACAGLHIHAAVNLTAAGYCISGRSDHSSCCGKLAHIIYRH